MADVNVECGRCDGTGVVKLWVLENDERESIEGIEDYEDDDEVACPDCGGDCEVWVAWDEPTGEMEGFDCQEDWEDNVF
jgi:hypothetical protein